MRLSMEIYTSLQVSSESILLSLGERESAHQKHGENSIEGVDDDNKMLAILVEEVGEIAKAMTYDNADPENLKKEIGQVMAVSWAWLDKKVSA